MTKGIQLLLINVMAKGKISGTCIKGEDPGPVTIIFENVEICFEYNKRRRRSSYSPVISLLKLFRRVIFGVEVYFI